MKNLLQISLSLIGVLMSITLVQSSVNPQIDLVKKAQKITVQINGKEQGTGVIVARGYKYIYTVLSSCHVFDLNYRNNLDNPNYKPQPKGYYVLRLYDGQEYPINAEEDVQCHPQVDLAIIQFKSYKDSPYSFAEIENSGQLKPNTPIYLYGWTTVDDISPERAERFEQGTVQAIRTNGQKGYTLIHNVVSRPAMSGGPLLDQQGRLIGINGLVNPQTKESYAVPINFYKNWNPDYIIAYQHFYLSAIPYNPDDFNNPQWIIFKHWLKVLQFLTQKGDSFKLFNRTVLSPDRQWLAMGGKDKNIKLWNLKTSKLERTFTVYSDYVNMEFSPDGQWLASGSDDGTIKLWNLKTGQLERTFIGHSDVIVSVAFSPDGQWLASGSLDDTIKLWNLKTGQLERTLRGYNPACNLAFSADGQWLASFGFDITVWKLPPTFAVTSPSKSSPSFTAQDYYELGKAYLADKEPEFAIEQFNEAIRLNPNNSGAYYNRGVAYASKENYEQAIIDYTQAIKINQNWDNFSIAHAYIERGFAYKSLKNDENALNDYNQAISLNPNSWTYYNRGNFYFEQKNYEQAVNDYTTAIEINNGWGGEVIENAYFYRGVAYYHQENDDQAIQDYNQYLQTYPDDAGAYYNRGLAYKDKGDKQKALEDFQKAAALYQKQNDTERYQKALDRIKELTN